MRKEKEIISLPEAVLLDWDGTLVDSYDFLKSAHNYVRHKHGYEIWDDETFKQVMRRSTREAFADLYGEQAEQIKDSLITYVDENYIHSLMIMDGAEDLLKTLKNSGLRAGVVSNKRHERLENDIRHLGWDKYIDVVVGAGAARLDKPAPDPILLALEKIRIAPSLVNVWYAGDTATDMESAQAAGVTKILLLHGVGGKELAEQYCPSYVFDDLREFIKAIDGVMLLSKEQKGLASARLDV